MGSLAEFGDIPKFACWRQISASFGVLGPAAVAGAGLGVAAVGGTTAAAIETTGGDTVSPVR